MSSSNKNANWWRRVCWYICVLSLTVICTISCFFVFSNWKSLIVDLDDKPTMLFMTVLGFLFAFAGINIYSIFNTNIEEEKRQLKIIQEEYQNKMRFTKTQWDHSILMMRYYQTCQLVIDSKKFNYQIYEWFFDINKSIDAFRAYLSSLYDEYHEEQFYSFRRDYMGISRGISIQLKSFQERINEPQSSFFKGINIEDKKICVRRLNELIEVIDSLGDEQYKKENDLSSFKEQPLSKRIVMFLKSIKESFSRHF